MNKLRKLCFLLAVMTACNQSWALSSDRDQPMLIEADQAELDDARGVSIYRGNVKVTQGTLVLTGDTMTVHSKGDDVTKVIMDGSPATYRQRPEGKESDVHAKSLRMEYYTSPEQVILLKQAEVVQEGDLLKSERIEYDIEHDQVNAGTNKPDDRVRITIQPKNRDEPGDAGKTRDSADPEQPKESVQDEPPGSTQPQ